MSNLLVSTHCDLDAVGVVVLTEYVKSNLLKKYEHVDIWFNDYLDYTNGLYNYDELANYDEIWYFDFTPDVKAREVIMDNEVFCTIGDHHEGIKQEIEEWDYSKKKYIFDNFQSGAKIYYNFLLSEGYIVEKPSIDQFIERVSVYDLYDKKNELWEEAQNLNRLLNKSITWSKTGLDRYMYFVRSMVNKISTPDNFVYNRIEESKIKEDKAREDMIFREFIDRKREIKTRQDNEGRTFSIIKLNAKISIIASRLLAKYSKLDYIIILNTFKEDAMKLSLRSDKINLVETFQDVSGHAGAAVYAPPNVDVHKFCERIWSGNVWCLNKKV